MLISVSVAVGVAVASAHSHEPDRNKLQFTIKVSPFFLLDFGRPGPSQGDQIGSNDRLLNASGHEVGHDGIACTMRGQMKLVEPATGNLGKVTFAIAR